MTDDVGAPGPRDLDQLGRRLGMALDAVEPSAAPVAAVVRKGKAMRWQRRIAVGAGIVAVVAAAVTVPGVIRHIGQAPPVGPAPKPPKPPVVKVTQLPPRAQDGVIAAGTINGKPWRIILKNKNDGDGCGLVISTGRPGDCSIYGGHAGGVPPSPDGGLGSGGSFDVGGAQVIWGPVSADVTLVRLMLTRGVTLELRPVTALGVRAVAVLIPAGLTQVEAIAFGAKGEVGYAVAFPGRKGDMPEFVRWLRPGDRGLPRQTVTIGTVTFGGHPVTAIGFAGPWGVCVRVYSPSGGGGACWVTPSVPGPFSAGAGINFDPSAKPRYFVGATTTGSGAAYLRLSMSNRNSVRVPVVTLDGQGFYLMLVPVRPSILSWAAYDASGHRLGGGTGSPDGGK